MPTGIAVVLAGVASACSGSVVSGDGNKPLPCTRAEDCPCASDAECPRGLVCLTQAEGEHCVYPCAAGCPAGWRCQGVGSAAGEVVLICLPEARSACAACSDDAQCGAEADLCVALGDASFCGEDCSADPCPQGYSCAEITSVAGAPGHQCRPDSGSCACRPGLTGFVRACEYSNTYGVCRGVESCGDDETWTPCTAEPPRRERCNGVDDDCDGAVDNLDSSLAPPEGATDYPHCDNGPGCTGEWICAELSGGGAEWVCTAPPGVSESCNGADDDCDGVVDNGFVDQQGRYQHVEACGGCGRSCLAMANLAAGPAAAACVLVGTEPTCVVNACAAGFAPYPPGEAARVCLPVTSLGCAPCNSSADCAAPTDVCMVVGGDDLSTCALDCAVGSPHGVAEPCTGIAGTVDCCPAGFLCTLVGTTPLCLPEGNTCACAPGSVGLTRPCLTTGVAGARCIGTEACLELSPGEPVWSACDATATTFELCNGVDDDCDGAIDEAFFDQSGTGTYDTDLHCGACGNNCQDRWNRFAHHVIGECALAPAPHCSFDPANCLVVPGPGGRPCDAGCSVGEVCLTRGFPGVRYDFFQCGRTCAQPSDCLSGQSCTDGVCQAACTIGAAGDAACQAAHGPQSRCRAGACQVDYQWRDLDHRQVTGCECPAGVNAGIDEPRTFDTYPDAHELYLDSDCDGVDGEAQASVFVSAANQSAADGSRDRPFPTIGEGLVALRADPTKRTLLVATGLYRENVVLQPGDRLYGGYSTEFTWRDVVGFPTVLLGVEPDWSDAGHERGSLSADCTGAGWAGAPLTEVSGFTIYGFDVSSVPLAGQPGRTTYAAYLRDCGTYLQLNANVLLGGRGGVGGHGHDGIIGPSGGDGGRGHDAEPCCTAGICPNCGGTLAGGASGVNVACAAAVGAVGDTSTAADARRGNYNCTASYCSLNCRYDCTTNASTNGANGANGADGVAAAAGGAGCSAANGSVVAGEWLGGVGGVGPAGGAGVGGAGGQAGPWVGYTGHLNPAGCQPNELFNRGDFGGTGGGGGAGGCGGGGGVGAAGGGGSFALFVFKSAASGFPLIRGNRLERGAGGRGGSGGFGGPGGEGGLGGLGGLALYPSWCAGIGGAGGRGGLGGAAGGGGGGCGGVTFSIGGRNIGSAGYVAANEILAGGDPGGPGGAGGGSPAGAVAAGGPGLAGGAGDLISFP